jgi:hypothetical protein
LIVADRASDDKQWHEVRPTMREKSHTVADIARALGPMKLTLMEKT